MGARHRVGIGLSYRPTTLHRLAELMPWNRFLGSINVLKYGLQFVGLSWISIMICLVLSVLTKVDLILYFKPPTP
jgi:hypothetical protein